MTTTDYNKQAIDFLEVTNTHFTAEFKEFSTHFDGDTQPRNIFNITLINSGHKFTFTFGASLEDSLENSGDLIYEKEIDFYAGLKFAGLTHPFLSYSDKIDIAKAKEYHQDRRVKHLLNRQKATTIYNDFVKQNTNAYIRLNIISLYEWLDKLEGAIIRKVNELSAKNFGVGVQAKNIIAPTAYDVLSCLTKYDCGDFENFCSECGYDVDSRKAYKTYKAVKREWENVKKLWTPEQIELLQEIQ